MGELTENNATIEPAESIEAPPDDAEELPRRKLIKHEIIARKEESAVLQTPVIKLTRRQLYDEIWEISVAGEAKKYDIPYAHLMKQVKEANIPVPPSGYWTKLSFGKPVTKLELSEPFDKVVSIFETAPTIPKQKSKEAAKSKAAAEALMEIDKVKEKSVPVVPLQTELVSELEPAPFDDPETIERYGQTYNVYNRETLYREVWEAPVIEVAKRYKVSDVTIHKVCKALEIPTPAVGYWAKLRAEKPVTVIPLPKSNKTSQKTGIQTGITYHPEIEKETLSSLSEGDRSVILAVALQILLPDETSRMHPKIIAHRKGIVEWKKQFKDNERKGWKQRNSELPPFLADTVSDETLPRACHIINALFKAMEPLDCSLTNDLGFIVNGETVRLSFSESQDKVAHIPTKEENLQLLEYEEERLGDIMIEIYEAAEALKKAREVREEAERKRQEEERRKEERRKRYNVEVNQTLALTNLAEDYDIACKIRQYISLVEESQSAEWIEWAKAKADWYDPTVAKKDEFFGKREHEKTAEEKKLKHQGYWW